MNTAAVVSVIASLVVGGAVGAGATHYALTATVTCSAPAEARVQPDGLQKLLEPTRIPLSGYKTY